MLATGTAVTDVMVRQDALAAIRPDGIWAQMGTIGVEATERLISEVANRQPDVDFVDAPVSGTREPARNAVPGRPRFVVHRTVDSDPTADFEERLILG